MNKYVVMLSGANRGIGLAIVREFYKDTKYCLSLGMRNTNNFDLNEFKTAKERLLVAHYDANNPVTGSAWIKNTLEKFGKIDSLINNAGILKSCGIENFNLENLDALWRVNTRAPILLTQEVWQHLKNSGQGRVINIVSIAGKISISNEFGYNISKHALLAYTHTLRQTGWNDGIRATAICHGWVNTDMAQTSKFCQLTSEAMTQPEDVAKLIKTIIELPNTASISELIINAECGQFF